MIKQFSQYLRTKFSLRVGKEAWSQTIRQAQANSGIEWANLWILLLAIIICAIGLNLNSPSIVIGAMLISPIMWPIVAVGVWLAIYDAKMIRDGLRNFAIACLLAIIVSWLYFWITPLQEATPEILLRTSPSLWDIIIAIAWWVVGAIALTRKEKWFTIIPWVAIATALMPPLCVGGYWLVQGEFIIALKAFYLLFINITYIAWATFVVAKALRLPKKQYLVQSERKKIQPLISLIVIIVVAIPGVLLTQNLLQQQFLDQQFTHFTKNISNTYSTQILQKVINPEKKTIWLRVIWSYLSAEEKETIKENLKSYKNLKDYSLTLRQWIDANPNLGEKLVQPLVDVALQSQEQQTLSLIQQWLQEYWSRLFVPERVLHEAQLLNKNIISLDFRYARTTQDTPSSGENQEKTDWTTQLTIAITTSELSSETEQQVFEEWIRLRTQEPDAHILWLSQE